MYNETVALSTVSPVAEGPSSQAGTFEYVRNIFRYTLVSFQTLFRFSHLHT